MTEQQKLTFTALQQRLDSLMLRDRQRFLRRLHGVKKVKNPDAQQAIFQEMAKEIDQAAGKVLLREAARPEITYPDNLPVSQKKQDILEAIRDHQVVIVAGETGSGKTTQLPKICMELGRGIKGLIGHTQPRRLAARTVANRIAEELKTEPGGCIGYKVRFSDHVSDNTMVKLMTDGILLAEIQQDRLLMQYDTIIIDEAHERSLNIDFLLGYLKEMLPKLDYWKRYEQLSDNGQFEVFKGKLIDEINALHIEGMPRLERLNALVGKYVNLEYRLPNGMNVRFLDDEKTYLGNQLECEFGGDRYFGVLADMDFILISTYEAEGTNPELVMYKKR